MIHTYKLEGMTCNNCKATVEKELLSIPQVTEANADIEKKQVRITMSTHVGLSDLQAALPDKYKIGALENDIEKKSVVAIKEPSKLTQLKPLFLILLYILTASVLLNYKNWSWSAFMLDFMGLFFIVFSFFKMLDLKGFPDSFAMYDPLAKRWPVYGKIYPFIETVLGLMFLLRFEVRTAVISTIIILSFTTYGVTKTLLDKKAIRCACLGTALKLPMTEATFIENAIMLIMAFAMLLS